MFPITKLTLNYQKRIKLPQHNHRKLCVHLTYKLIHRPFSGKKCSIPFPCSLPIFHVPQNILACLPLIFIAVATLTVKIILSAVFSERKAQILFCKYVLSQNNSEKSWKTSEANLANI
jgi:hypothetical protein